MWSALENSVAASTDPTAVLHSHLASALGTLGDAHFWEESISPSEIRSSLADADPNNPSSTHTLLKGMKWLLASISKGRDVSDFYVLVVKLVACPVTEVRKMVYTFLVQYADHNAETRELSLLSINSFQRGLSDSEPLIRALALRVLTSVHLPDILAIQILAVTKHAKADTSPYVRKCAAVAIAKLAPRCSGGGRTNNSTATPHHRTTSSVSSYGDEQRDILLELVQYLLETDRTTMVLSSALIAYAELTGAATSALHMLHGCFRKLCHLLTDMDEWGQIVALEVLTRYGRHFFAEPMNYAAGSAEQIDAVRRVRRRQASDGTVTTEPPNHHHPLTTTPPTTAVGGGAATVAHTCGHHHHPVTTAAAAAATATALDDTPAGRAAAAGVTLPPRKVIKRRVLKKGFYSDEEDASTEEEVAADTFASTSKQPRASMHGGGVDGNVEESNKNPFDAEEGDLDEDHRFLLRSAMSLLKSRNAGVVLAVCSLQYYCGVSSVPVRKAMGKALVRIHRAKHREIQYVVLTSIRKLVKECPSAFSPFLHDFFVLPDMDPPFTRLIKLDILTSLALDPPSISIVLKELRTYVHVHYDSDDYTDDNTTFVCAAVRAVGRVAEMAQIVYGRHSAGRGERCAEADTIALNCLFGLVTFSQAADNEVIVGETVIVMQRILQMLQADGKVVQDPNHVRDRALQRILLLLVNTLSCVIECDGEAHGSDDDSQDDMVKLEHITLILPPPASASALWLMGDYLAPLSSNGSESFGKLDIQGRATLRLELARLLVRCFIDLDVPEKEQAIHFASKLLLTKETMSVNEGPLCERLLALGRVDYDPSVRDCARYESGLIHLTIGLKDLDGMDETPESLNGTVKLSVDDARRIFLSKKPASSYLPLENEKRRNGEASDRADCDDDVECFRYGTLSSLVGHRARSAYLPLPPWAKTNSPSSLRDPPGESNESRPTNVIRRSHDQRDGFYESPPDSDGSSSDEAVSESSSESESDDDESSDRDTGDDNGAIAAISEANTQHTVHTVRNTIQPSLLTNISATESSSSESDSDDDSSDESVLSNEDLLPLYSNDVLGVLPTDFTSNETSSAADDLTGLVLLPLTVSTTEPSDVNFDRDSGGWMQIIRPEHSGGLLVEGRYLRGVTKAKQAQAMDLLPEKPSVVCIQFRLENQKPTNGGSIRHIRMMQRTLPTSSSMIGPRKVVLPLEISELPVGRRVECVVGIDFANTSDRDGSLVAKLDFKYGSGGTTIELKPTIGDLMLPCFRTLEQFDASVQRLHGFNRVETNFSVSESSRSVLPSRLLSRAALSVVGAAEASWENGSSIRWAGILPHSTDPVFVLTSCSEAGRGSIQVCCEHALVANSIMNLLKRAILE